MSGGACCQGDRMRHSAERACAQRAGWARGDEPPAACRAEPRVCCSSALRCSLSLYYDSRSKQKLKARAALLYMSLEVSDTRSAPLGQAPPCPHRACIGRSRCCALQTAKREAGAQAPRGEWKRVQRRASGAAGSMKRRRVLRSAAPALQDLLLRSAEAEASMRAREQKVGAPQCAARSRMKAQRDGRGTRSGRQHSCCTRGGTSPARPNLEPGVAVAFRRCGAPRAAPCSKLGHAHDTHARDRWLACPHARPCSLLLRCMKGAPEHAHCSYSR